MDKNHFINLYFKKFLIYYNSENKNEVSISAFLNIIKKNKKDIDYYKLKFDDNSSFFILDDEKYSNFEIINQMCHSLQHITIQKIDNDTQSYNYQFANSYSQISSYYKDNYIEASRNIQNINYNFVGQNIYSNIILLLTKLFNSKTLTISNLNNKIILKLNLESKTDNEKFDLFYNVPYLKNIFYTILDYKYINNTNKQLYSIYDYMLSRYIKDLSLIADTKAFYEILENNINYYWKSANVINLKKMIQLMIIINNTNIDASFQSFKNKNTMILHKDTHYQIHDNILIKVFLINLLCLRNNLSTIKLISTQQMNFHIFDSNNISAFNIILDASNISLDKLIQLLYQMFVNMINKNDCDEKWCFVESQILGLFQSIAEKKPKFKFYFRKLFNMIMDYDKKENKQAFLSYNKKLLNIIRYVYNGFNFNTLDYQILFNYFNFKKSNDAEVISLIHFYQEFYNSTNTKLLNNIKKYLLNKYEVFNNINDKYVNIFINILLQNKVLNHISDFCENNKCFNFLFMDKKKNKKINDLSLIGNDSKIETIDYFNSISSPILQKNIIYFLILCNALLDNNNDNSVDFQNTLKEFMDLIYKSNKGYKNKLIKMLTLLVWNINMPFSKLFKLDESLLKSYAQIYIQTVVDSYLTDYEKTKLITYTNNNYRSYESNSRFIFGLDIDEMINIISNIQNIPEQTAAYFTEIYLSKTM